MIGPGYFVMLRYRNTGYMEPVQDDSASDGETAEVALFAMESEAQEWIDGSGLVDSGQGTAAIYPAPE